MFISDVRNVCFGGIVAMLLLQGCASEFEPTVAPEPEAPPPEVKLVPAPSEASGRGAKVDPKAPTEAPPSAPPAAAVEPAAPTVAAVEAKKPSAETPSAEKPSATSPPLEPARPAGKVPDCKPTEAVHRGGCVPKEACPAGVTKDLKRCAPIPECPAQQSYVHARRGCVDKGKECGQGRVWLAAAHRCAIKGAECRQGWRWLETKGRCVLKGAECGADYTWVSSKGRCVVKGAECSHQNMEWSTRFERCVPSSPVVPGLP